MIRCLVVDDARAFRAVLRHILSAAPGVEVVGEAADGREAVALVRSLRPDVVTMDVRMPNLDGLAAIQQIMQVAPTPVIVVSAEAGEEAQQLSFRALQFGAIEVLAKPRDPGTPGFDRQAEAIRQAVRAVAGLVLVGRRHTVAAPQVARRVGSPPVHGAPGRPPGRPEVLALAASTGGPAALREILSRLPADLPVPLLVVQHIAPGFEGGLARWLAAAARRPQGTDAAVFLVGEFVKVVSTIALLALVVATYKNLVWLAMLVSIIAVLKSYVLALLIK